MSAQTDRFVHDRLPPREQQPQMRYDLPELQLPDRLNLVEALFSRAFERGGGDRPMLRSRSLTLTYREASARVDRIAHVLTRDLALVPGNRVLLRGGNSVALSLVWLAVVKAGLIVSDNAFVATPPPLSANRTVKEAVPAAAGVPLMIHSTLVWLLAETGIAGTAVFLGAAWHLFSDALRRRGDPAAVLLLLALCALAVMSLAHEMLYQRAFWLLLGAVLAMPAVVTAGGGRFRR